MSTSSDGPGTWGGLQLSAVPQSELPVFQMIVKAGATMGCENSDVLRVLSVVVALMKSLPGVGVKENAKETFPF